LLRKVIATRGSWHLFSVNAFLSITFIMGVVGLFFLSANLLVEHQLPQHDWVILVGHCRPPEGRALSWMKGQTLAARDIPGVIRVAFQTWWLWLGGEQGYHCAPLVFVLALFVSPHI
jgi:hypothetical protein